jgi:hypothetical protein
MNENAARIVDECIHKKKACLDLRGCDLSGCDLNMLFIPFQYSRQNLEYAPITGISLRDTGITVLPDCIGSFFALKTLDAGNTGLSELPESIANLSGLENLFLDHTDIVRLPEGLLRLPVLKKVVVYDNIIFPLRQIKKALKETRKETTEKKEEPEMPPPLVDDSVGDMMHMLYDMARISRLKPGHPSMETTVMLDSCVVDPLHDTPRQMILGNRLIGFNIVPGKTKSSAHGGQGFCMYFDIDPNSVEAALKEKLKLMFLK